MKPFRLRFPTASIPLLAEKYVQELPDRDRRLEDEIEKRVFPRYLERGHLTKEEFLAVYKWKTPRTKSRCAKNAEEFIKEVSEIVLKTRSERLRIEILTLLHGVGWPTASVFLHFAFEDRYPILDYRALESLGIKEPVYDFKLWSDYADFCRKVANLNRVSMRALDRALWKYSEMNQGKSVVCVTRAWVACIE